ncbi:hypothetical protein [Frankia sp. Cj3]|uniref:VMAP-C domain-containing protein n=1 Tax=Frankia sp. Cj3 TaxID=2880976 RepID=UPI001EF63C06|nr:hypothetical protein [Frankia sp. Cj3]
MTDRETGPPRDGILRADIEDRIVRVLLERPELRPETSRQLFLHLVGEAGGPSQVADYPTAAHWFVGLVALCSRRSSMAALVTAADRLRVDSAVVRGLWLLQDEWDAVEIAASAPAGLWALLRDELDAVPSVTVAEPYRLAIGHRGLEPPHHCVTAWHTLVHLAGRNAARSTLPPYMVFLERVRDTVTPSTAQKVDLWNSRRAYELKLTAALDAVRSERTHIPGRPPQVHLMIQFDPADADPESYVVSWWRQWDGRIEPGGHQWLSHDELESHVEAVVRRLETELSGHASVVAIEFIVPFALLNVPVDWWQREAASGVPKPLALDYPVVLRSLERLRRPDWHRMWHRRWHQLHHGPGRAGVYWSRPDGSDHLLRLETTLASDERLVALVLSEPPEATGGTGMGEALMALRAGLPVVLWHRSRRLGSEHEDTLRLLVDDGDMSDLPGRVRRLRIDALLEPAGEAGVRHVGRNLAFLWDDPGRQPERGSPGPFGMPRGEIGL